MRFLVSNLRHCQRFWATPHLRSTFSFEQPMTLCDKVIHNRGFLLIPQRSYQLTFHRVNASSNAPRPFSAHHSKTVDHSRQKDSESDWQCFQLDSYRYGSQCLFALRSTWSCSYSPPLYSQTVLGNVGTSSESIINWTSLSQNHISRNTIRACLDDTRWYEGQVER